jgi:hypothetical protein
VVVHPGPAAAEIANPRSNPEQSTLCSIACLMTSPSVRNDVQIDDACSAAICKEIADRLLRTTAAGESGRLPQRIKILVEQMAGMDIIPTVRGHSVSDGVD